MTFWIYVVIFAIAMILIYIAGELWYQWDTKTRERRERKRIEWEEKQRGWHQVTIWEVLEEQEKNSKDTIS